MLNEPSLQERRTHNSEPKRTTVPAHGRSVVTSILVSRGCIITASDDHTINIYSLSTGKLLRSLNDHTGGVWAIAVTKETLVSGGTDRTVRVWDLTSGRCTHVFTGHTLMVRCVIIVKPEWVDAEGSGITGETWPKRSLIVTGSRDNSLRVWTLPQLGDSDHQCCATQEGVSELEIHNTSHLQLHLEGHDSCVRALAVRGRTIVSGSYDCTVRVWDIVTGECKWILHGHTQKVYSAVYDMSRNIACSGSMDGTVRVWDLHDGQCRYTLSGHTSLVGLLSLSPTYLVSGSADSTIRVWKLDTGELHSIFAGHNKGAVTCLYHDEHKLLAGRDGSLEIWDLRAAPDAPPRKMLDVGCVWQVVRRGRWCAAASIRRDGTMLDIWDFGNEGDAMSDEDSSDDEV